MHVPHFMEVCDSMKWGILHYNGGDKLDKECIFYGFL